MMGAVLHPSSSVPPSLRHAVKLTAPIILCNTSAPQQTDELTATISCIACPAAIKVTALGPPALLETASNSLLQIRSLFRRFDAGALCCALVCAWRWPLACSLLCHVAAGALWGDAGGGCWLVSTLPCWHCTPPTITWSVPCASTQSQDTPNDAVPQPLCADGNGTITKDEFEQAYREMFVDEPDWVGRGVGQAESHRSCAGVALRLAVLRSALTAALPCLLPHTAWLLHPPPPQAFSHLDVNKRGLVDYVSWQVELQRIGTAAC